MKTLELSAPRQTLSAYLELTKPGISMMVAVTTVVCAYMGFSGDIDLVRLLHAFVASILVASGGNALNMFMERDSDRQMRRTRMRPLPQNRIHPAEAFLFGLSVALLGAAYFTHFVNPTTGLISVISVGSYVLLYTPLKKKTELCTVVGAVPGALPALAGWTAARGTIDPAGIVLFAILFLWQVPHFFAIGWIYREDYANARIPILPVIDPQGERTAFQSILFTALLFLVSLLPTLLRMTGWIYLVGAMGLGGFFLTAALRFRRNRTIPVARKLFFASILYLPLLWAFMVIDKV